jgi:hypothetical protein
MLSKQALNIVLQVFGEKSNWQFPAGVANEILEIRQWAKAQLNPLAEPQ